MKLPFAVTLGPGSSRADHTGAWRTERAVYVERTAPCGNACPAGEDVRTWLYDAESGGAGYESAWRRIMETNPFPAVCGRVCYHPCETACNRGNLDEAVGINSVERFLGDEALAQGWRVEVTAAPTGRRVLVVGSGPAGLSAAYHLARRGHAVTIRESAPVAGGMMRYGIPRYRLPREVLDAEITRLLDLGITLEVDTPVTDLDAVMADEGWDAAFLAVGAQLGHRTYLPAASAARVLDAVSLLHGLEDGERPLLGRRVAVYGGGNTAVDAARTARRLGASDAVVVYRRTRERMPAHAEEVADAEEEGVVFHWLSTIERVEPDGLVIEQMELDEDGFPQPTGRTERLAADSVVLALGQDTDLSFLGDASALQVSGGTIDTDSAFATTRTGVFAGGDVVAGERSVTIAIGHGRRAAESIDDWLAGRPPAPVPLRSTWRRTRPSTPGTSRTPTAPTASASTWPGAAPRSTRWCTASTATRRSTRPGAACRAGAASPATTATRCAPTTPSSSSGPPASTSSTSTTARAAGSASRSAQSGAIVMVPEET